MEPLQGSGPEDAFFVNVGLGKTMTALDILEGRMVADIGMAAVRSAEFIILRFIHKLPEATGHLLVPSFDYALSGAIN